MTTAGGRAGVAARALAGLCPVAFAGCAWLAGATMGLPWYAVALAAVVAVGYADTGGPLLVWALLGLLWVTGVPAFSWWVLPAALAALLGHGATAYLAGAPPSIDAPRRLLRRWSARAVIVSGVTAAMAAAVTGVRSLELDGSTGWTVVVLVAVAAGLYAVRPQRVSED